jgi:hypothetical protein
MAKLTLSDVTNLQNEQTAVATINNNSAATETALENTLSRDGTSPNSMESDLDMDSNRILNLPDAQSNQEPVTLSQFITASTDVSGLLSTAPYVTIGNTSLLTTERALTAGTGITVTDGGAGSTVSVGLAQKPSFFAHRNGSSQTGIADSTTTKISLTTERLDIGGYFSTVNSRWTPPAGTVLLIAGAVLDAATTMAAGNAFVLQIYKNGTTVIGACNIVAAVASSYIGATTAAIDVANGTDYYEAFVFVDTTGGTATLNGNEGNTYLCGTYLSA